MRNPCEYVDLMAVEEARVPDLGRPTAEAAFHGLFSSASRERVPGQRRSVRRKLVCGGTWSEAELRRDASRWNHVTLKILEKRVCLALVVVVLHLLLARVQVPSWCWNSFFPLLWNSKPKKYCKRWDPFALAFGGKRLWVSFFLHTSQQDLWSLYEFLW